MVHFIEIIYFLLILKAIFRCLYFWQLKEYRFDRFKDLLFSSDKRKYFFPIKYLLRPRFTIKIILLIYLSFYFSFQVLKINHQVLAPVIAYLSIPLITTFSVFLVNPLSDIVQFFVILLARIKIRFYSKKLTVIGITGSFGKTSTKEILTHILSTKYKVLKTTGTQNTIIGIATTILKKLNKHHQIFVIEMGAYKIGEIKQICRLVKPQIGIITGITKQHLSLFGSLNNLIKAKYELIESLPVNGLAVFNLDDSQATKLKNQTKHLKTLGFNLPKTNYKTNLHGLWQQSNIQAAAVVSKYLGISRKIINRKVLSIPLIKTAISKTLGLNKAVIINNTYNSNPVGFSKALTFANSINKPKKLLITSGIIELGSESKAIHTELIKKAIKQFNLVILTKKNLTDIKSPRLIVETDYQKILTLLKTKLDSSSVVLLESRMPKKFIKSICSKTQF